MRLIYEPTIRKAWVTVACPDELREYIDPWEPEDWESGDTIPEIAGRVCYQSFGNPRPGGNHAYMLRILSEGHGSVTEHATIGFIISGVSRSLTHELIRHRAGTAVSELSQRFVDASDLGFVVPPKHGNNPPPAFLDLCHVAKSDYQSLSDELKALAATTLERKRIRESARSVLPNCTETHIAFTANLRAWRNVLEQRGNIHADLEIRRLAVALLPRLAEYAPNVFQDFETFVDEDGHESVRYQWRKV